MKMEDRPIRQSPLFLSLNEVLSRRMPAIQQEIEQSVREKGYCEVLQAINLKLNIHPWQQVTQWRIDAEADECDASGQPQSLGGFVSMEEVEGLETLTIRYGIYNTLDIDEVDIDQIRIVYAKAYDPEFVTKWTKMIDAFLDQLCYTLVREASVFVRAWLKEKKD